MAARLSDRKERGMLSDTLIVWGGEFGRTPEGQNEDGRRHNSQGYTMMLAGGGVERDIRIAHGSHERGSRRRSCAHI